MGKKSGSGKNIPDPQHWFSLTWTIAELKIWEVLCLQCRNLDPLSKWRHFTVLSLLKHLHYFFTSAQWVHSRPPRPILSLSNILWPVECHSFVPALFTGSITFLLFIHFFITPPPPTSTPELPLFFKHAQLHYYLPYCSLYLSSMLNWVQPIKGSVSPDF
jgi:hypothetical protein